MLIGLAIIAYVAIAIIICGGPKPEGYIPPEDIEMNERIDALLRQDT